MSRRIQIVLPDPAAEELSARAGAEGTPPSTLAAQLVREQLQQDQPATRRASVPDDSRRASRPSWLEPYGGSSFWKAETWGTIVALHGRYPRTLAALKDGWWVDQGHLEQLSALAAWRGLLDTAGEDPREELAFHAQLADYGHALKTEGGGVERAWQPGAPPHDWAT